MSMTMTTTTTTKPDNNGVYDGCYQTKGCFGQPDDCVQKRNCDMIMTYTKEISSGKEENSRFLFEVGGSASQDYVALGLSDDNKMGSDSVMACIHQAQHNPAVSMYWNFGHSASTPLHDPGFGLQQISGLAEDGFFLCSFYRDVVTNISVPDNNNQTVSFDLENTQYYLLLATGPTKNNLVDYHSGGQGVSSQPVDLSKFNHVSGSKNIVIKVHASFMVLAWIFCANLGQSSY